MLFRALLSTLDQDDDDRRCEFDDDRVLITVGDLCGECACAGGCAINAADAEQADADGEAVACLPKVVNSDCLCPVTIARCVDGLCVASIN